ncbi:MAG: hypothetical protein EA383_12690 [Spirochaetaceae bacterium]|nr:MAG: hypothetical protein EA383_12690 [Spirochaetaceae bacterium]
MQKSCEQCGSAEAVIQVSVAAGTSRNDFSLCEVCAEKLGIHSNQQHTPVLNDLYQSILRGSNRLRRRLDESRCRQCGTRFGDIRRSGTAGCASCYASFSSGIRDLLEITRSDLNYGGRLPQRVDALRRIFVTREQLRQRLEEAVAQEDYEHAAKLREDMRRLENGSSEQNDV